MAFERVAAWFVTEAGRQFSYILAGTTCVGVLLTKTLPHTVLIDPYKDFLHLYNKGLTVPLPQKLKDRFNKALDLAEVESQDKHLFQPFSAYGFDIVSAGTSYSRYGVIIGLPANFAYDDVSNVEKHKIKINQDSVAWETDEAKAFSNSLVLPENAQLYAITREIKLRDTCKLLFDTVFATFACAGTFGLSHNLNKRLNLFNRPLPFRLVMYSLVCTFMGGNYVFAKDMSQVYYEQKIDKELKQKSPILAEGGRVYYSKILQRNIALRKLLGKEGQSIYTALGNENYLFRTKHVPLVDRKLFFEKQENSPEGTRPSSVPASNVA